MSRQMSVCQKDVQQHPAYRFHRHPAFGLATSYHVLCNSLPMHVCDILLHTSRLPIFGREMSCFCNDMRFSLLGLLLPPGSLPGILMKEKDSMVHHASEPTHAFSHHTLPSRARRTRPLSDVTEARAAAQRAKLNSQGTCRQAKTSAPIPKEQKRPRSSQRNKHQQVTIAEMIEAYLSDQVGGNHSQKTIEWHRTALGFFQAFLEHEQEITLLQDMESAHISAWLAFLREVPVHAAKFGVNEPSRRMRVRSGHFVTGWYAANPLSTTRLIRFFFRKLENP